MERKKDAGRIGHSGSSSLGTVRKKLHDGTFSELFSDWKWIFSYSKKYKWFIVLYTVIGLLGSGLSVAASYTGRVLINVIVKKEIGKVWLLAGVMLSSTVLSLVFSSVTSRLSAKISVSVRNDVQAQIFERIIDARWSEFGKFRNGDVLNRFNSDVGAIASNAIGWIPGLVINVFTFALTFVILLLMDPIMALIAIVAAPILLLMSRFIMRRMKEYRKKMRGIDSDMMSFESEAFANYDMIKSFGAAPFYAKRLKQRQDEYRDCTLECNGFEIKANVLMTLTSALVSFAAFGYCLYRLWTGQILFGDMTFFLDQRSRLSARFNALAATVPGMINSAVSARRVRELIELEGEPHCREDLDTLREIAGDGISVELSGVSFAYREGAGVFGNCDFSAHPGETVAVLGPSGEGKTTLLRLILGLVLPEEGEVTLRGSDGRKIPMNADLRELFSYVPQGSSVTSGTVADNLRMVKEDATDEEITGALKAACAWEFVETLPGGIYGCLGDGGKGISTGQAQRISIARAILRDSPVLLLDEATSALDAETEKKVLANILKMSPNRTCIISTHRESVLGSCKKVYRIGGGKTNEQS
ncbi:MAG: ABC transporter ATP-binding protein/permease [Clostridia bacterium]|nr:ABC transporter ATP-binding protein/permease [Clostridia bacterium]